MKRIVPGRLLAIGRCTITHPSPHIECTIPASRQHSRPEESMPSALSKRVVLLALAALAASCSIYFSSPITSNLDTTPTNDLPNPYKTVAPWGRLPADHGQWGALNGVAVDNDGVSLWVVDRCGANPEAPSNDQAYQFDSCAGSSWAPVHKLDAQGNIVKNFGTGMFVF